MTNTHTYNNNITIETLNRIVLFFYVSILKYNNRTISTKYGKYAYLVILKSKYIHYKTLGIFH